MLVGIHQLHYLPWLRYFEKIAHCDVFIVLDNIQFNKNGWQNRNKIKSPSGAQLLSIPVHAGFGETLDKIRIDNKKNWCKKHFETIRCNYAKVPFLVDYIDFLRQTYEQKWEHLNEINLHMLKFYIDTLGIDTPVVYASDLNVPGTATERLVNLIKAVDGDCYYSGAHAIEVYLDADILAASGIGLELQEWNAPIYPQLHGDFQMDLSILDLLFNCGPESLSIIMGNRI